MQQKPKPLSEAHIQQTCTEWLQLDGWRAVVTDPPQLRGLGVSERGIPDRLYIRYEKQTLPPTFEHGAAQILWIEWKRKKKAKTSAEQLNWHCCERARGALVWLAGVDFAASIEGFQAHYIASGLARRLHA